MFPGCADAPCDAFTAMVCLFLRPSLPRPAQSAQTTREPDTPTTKIGPSRSGPSRLVLKRSGLSLFGPSLSNKNGPSQFGCSRSLPSGPWLFCAIVKMEGCQDLADDMRRRYPIVRKNACVSALKESQRYERARVCMCHGWDGGITAILCSNQVSQVRRSWETCERCTSILIESMMML